MGKKNKGLGRSLIKQKPSSRLYDSSSLHTTELNDGYDWGRANVTSITEQNDLDEFLATAELAGIDFTAEKQNVTVVNAGNTIPGRLSERDKAALKDLHEKHRDMLRVPRRPQWDANTTAEELHSLEKESFVTWRRQLAELQEVEGIIMTPYEKNLEFWRQLWRVIERSDVLVQIVDARNPLLFYCEDLTQYVREVDPEKKCLVLLNKADFLNADQREAWWQYLDSIGMQAVFFSALQEGGSKPEERDDSDNESESGSSTNSCEDRKTAPHFEDPLVKTNGPHLYSKDQLLHLFETIHPRPKGEGGKTVVGLVGYPNVGKSSTINALLQSKKVSVSSTPGKTKHFQTLHLGDELCLCDCPGLVFPNFVSNKAEMIIYGILPIDQMTDHVPPVNLVAGIIPRHVLESTYGIHIPPPHETEDPSRPPTAEELLNSYGYMRGYMSQGGVPDRPRSSRYILKDFVRGKLLYCVAPPGLDQNTYHPFPPPSSGRRKILEHARGIKDRRTTSKDIDKDFFVKRTPQAHSKGRAAPGMPVPTGEAGSSTSESKPWKKHHNAKKREKLRRVYAEHDI